jgi:hypothetical protein
MGAGILPTTIYNNQLYFLFGKENKFADTPGWSDFGGGTDNKESYMQTAMREGTEELTGFLGMEKEIGRLLRKKGTYNIDHTPSGHSTYRLHIFPMVYDEKLPFYYNNNQRFLQRKLDPKLLKDSKIFEKAEIKWVSADQLLKMKKQFRSYFQDVVEKISREKSEIEGFIRKGLKTMKNKTRKLRSE